MKISDLLDAIEDDSVPIREREIAASGRIMEATMAKIHAGKEEPVPVGKRVRKGTALVILAAAFLVLSVTALAAGLAGRIVNWKGESVTENGVEPNATVPPDVQYVGGQDLDTLLNSILENRAERELVIVRHDGGGRSAARTAPAASAAEVERRLTQENSALTIPVSVPDEFVFSGGWIAYDSSAGYGYSLEKTETMDGNIVVDHYSADPEGDFISSYALVFVNGDDEYLSIRGELQEDMSRTGFGLYDGDTSEKLELPGMDDALLITGTEYTNLYMRSTLDHPIAYVSVFSLMGGAGETQQYSDAVYSIRTTSAGLAGEAIKALILPR